jgi:signal transduction histidine kinase
MGFDAALTEQRERRRIAIGLHDQVGQALALAEIKLCSVRGELADGPRAAVDGAVELLEEAIAAQRSLVFELSPPILYDLGLEAALAWLAEDVEKRYGVRLEIHDDGANKPLTDGAKAIVFRAIRELIMNVLKHARVPSATITLRRRAEGIEVDVQDQGVGFEPEALGRGGGGFGLLSVREQISGLGGTLEVETAAQQGTRVKLSVPLAANGSEAGAANLRNTSEGAP